MQKPKSPIATPDDILAKASRKWNDFIKARVAGTDDGFFPIQLNGLRFKPSKGATLHDMISAVTLLDSKSKTSLGYGYTVEKQRKSFRDWGQQNTPVAVTIDTEDDFVRLLNKHDELTRTETTCRLVREKFPVLESWLHERASRLHTYTCLLYTSPSPRD